MRYLVNFSNQVAAGPRMIAKNFVLSACKNSHSFTFLVPDSEYYRKIPTTENVELIYLDSKPGSFRSLFLVFYVNYYLIFQLCKKQSYDGIIAFGNFYLGSRKNKVALLLHHPYLVDDALYNRLRLKDKAIECLKRLLFKRTLKKVQSVIVQTSYMRDLLLAKYGFSKANTHVIHNPISDFFKNATRENFVFEPETITLFYPSRFYKHKNHALTLEVAKLARELKLPIEVHVTIDPAIPEAARFLKSAKGVSNFINIGEVPQEALVKYYQNSAFMLFTSLSETYGNPLAEAVVCELPVIAPDLGYARSILQESGNYFSIDIDVSEQAREIIDIVASYENSSYELNVQAVRKQKQRFPFVNEWFNRLMKLL